jgi:ABC-type transport system substrate-binding protein
MRKRFALTASVMAFVLVAAGCASSGSSSAAAAEAGPTFPISITVDNNLQGLKPVTVTIVRPGGGKILGTVDSGRRRTFSYDATAGTYSFNFRTTTPTDPVVTSTQVQIAGPITYTWHLASNTLVEGQ